MQRESNYAIFNYERGDGVTVDAAAEYLDKKAERIYSFFEVAPSKKAVIHIVPTKEEFYRLYKQLCEKEPDYKVPNWVNGFVPKSGESYLLSINDYKGTTHEFAPTNYDEAVQDCKKTIVHEFVHHVNKLFNKSHNCSMSATWLIEELATLLSGQVHSSLTIKCPLEDIIQGRARYSDYYLLTKYFVNNYPKDVVLELLQSSRLANQFLRNELYAKANEFYNNKRQEQSQKAPN